MPIIIALLLLVGCATPKGPWVVAGPGTPEATQARANELVEAAKRVTPDRKGWLSQGGTIWLKSYVGDTCYALPPKIPTGCAAPQSIWILYPHPAAGYDLDGGALPHELCHLGLAKGGAFGGPLDTATDDQADACSLLVRQAVMQ